MIGSCYEEKVVRCEVIKEFGNKEIIGIKKEAVVTSIDFDRVTIQFSDETEMILSSRDQESYMSEIIIEKKEKGHLAEEVSVE